jgi:hypothetical protein
MKNPLSITPGIALAWLFAVWAAARRVRRRPRSNHRINPAPTPDHDQGQGRTDDDKGIPSTEISVTTTNGGSR